MMQEIDEASYVSWPTRDVSWWRIGIGAGIVAAACWAMMQPLLLLLQLLLPGVYAMLMN
jgi:hypothetical protein